MTESTPTNAPSLTTNKECLYIFLDEAGNFDFTKNGTRYFILTALVKKRPFFAYKELGALKYDLIENGTTIEYFHASEDKQLVRDRVFSIISKNIEGCDVHTTVIEKNKTNPSIRDPLKFYPKILGYLLSHVIDSVRINESDEVLVFTDTLPTSKGKQAMEKAVKTSLKEKLPPNVRYHLFHHASKSNADLQIVDYLNWAIFRKWERGDTRSYSLIKDSIRSEFDFFRRGTTTYYTYL